VPVSLPGPWGQDSPRPPLPRRPAPPSPAAAGRTAGGQGGARQLPPTARLRQALERSLTFLVVYLVEMGVREKSMITSQNINYEVTKNFGLNTENLIKFS